MFKFRSMAMLILLATVTSAISDTKIEKTITAEEKKVLSVISKMTDAFHAGDIEKVMANYESNSTIMFEPGKPVSDPKLLREMFKGFFAVSPTFKYSGHEVFIENDIAMHITPWTMTGKAPDGSIIKQSGLSVAVLRRQSDGNWLMVIDNPHGQNLMKNQ
jgi:ketosteroid isomerase-like protein